jgi:hypothetical protein
VQSLIREASHFTRPVGSQRVRSRLEGSHHAGCHGHDQELDDRHEKERARRAVKRKVDLTVLVVALRESPADVEPAKRTIRRGDDDGTWTLEFGARPEAMCQQTENQALLGFVRLRVTVEDPRFADQRQEFRIAFDIRNDIEQPLRR